LAQVDLDLLLEKSLALPALVLFLVLLLLLAADMERVFRFQRYPEALGVAAAVARLHTAQVLGIRRLHHRHRATTVALDQLMVALMVLAAGVALAQ
jgi:hypothetical protein